MIQNLKLDFADYLVAEIAVVDSTGAVVHCNRKWEETAEIGGLLPQKRTLRPKLFNLIDERAPP